MSKAYDPELIKTALNLANEMGMGHETHTGVYTCLGGPNYETVAELKMWKVLGVDAVGMSTVKPWRILGLHYLIANFFPSSGSRSHHSTSLRHESFCLLSYHQQMRD